MPEHSANWQSCLTAPGLGWGRAVILGLPLTSPCVAPGKKCQLCPRPQLTAEESGGAHRVGIFPIETSELLSTLHLQLWSPASSSDILWEPVKRTLRL